ncbi:extensin-like [Lathyrus oleraceus]|uniref:extensin-like n=1 Tax=Pisum sativum TaxID=3888 RepID=UPI0021D26B01|nr:extensin-like [Pisum sativum]
MLLKDTSVVVQHTSKASDTTSSKLLEASTPITSDSVIFKRILPIKPPSTSQSIPVTSKPSKPILLPPPPKSPTIKYVTETPQVSETLSQQQQHIPSPLSPSQLQISPNPPPFIYAPQPINPNFTTSRTSPSRVSNSHVSKGTLEGMFNYEPEPVLSDP